MELLWSIGFLFFIVACLYWLGSRLGRFYSVYGVCKETSCIFDIFSRLPVVATECARGAGLFVGNCFIVKEFSDDGFIYCHGIGAPFGVNLALNMDYAMCWMLKERSCFGLCLVEGAAYMVYASILDDELSGWCRSHG